MTEKLYWNDAYLKEFEAKLTEIAQNTVVLDRSAFYPTGGGQPNDTGTLYIGNDAYTVLDVKKEGDKIIHVLAKQPMSNAGDGVKGIIDWQRRYAHMRYHTAVHVIDGIIEKDYGGMATGGQIYETRARVDFDLPSLNADTALAIIAKAQTVINEGHRISARVIKREEALKIPNLARTEPGKELIKSLPEVRVLDIEGFDVQSDGGTHVANTKEVGTIQLKKVESKGTHRKRMEILLI